VADVLIAPNGQSGWHAHPGMAIVSVISGMVRRYNKQCESQVFKAGEAFFESTSPHNLHNVGSDNFHATVVFIVAQGQPQRLDRAAPPCAAGIDLN
jgi:quercetin dioxygenase-like cupin family protein